MAVTAREIIERARRLLFDPTRVRWTDAELLEYVNDAQAQIVLYRPDAAAVTERLPLVQGSRQTLAATSRPSIRLLRVVRNLRETSSGVFTAGGAVREGNRLGLDSEVPSWHAYSSGQSNVDAQHFVFDNFDPRSFYVYPAVNRINASGSLTANNFNVGLEIVYSAVPAELKVNGIADSTGSTFSGTTSDDLDANGLGDQFAATVLDWVMYRAYSKDSNYAGNFGRAVAHLQSFTGGLGVSVKNALRASIPSGADRTLMQAPREVP